jgi:aspartate racemase
VKTLGIIGGLGPESTVDYYRAILESCRARAPEAGAPRLVIVSLDVGRLIAWMQAGQLEEVADYLVEGVRQLAGAGADLALISANTPHIVFDEVQARSPLALVSIVEATRDAVRARGFRRVALLGTRFTMQARFFPDVLGRAGIELVLPAPEEQALIHEKYLGELIPGRFLPATRDAIAAIATRLHREERVEAVILGGTELPLLLRDAPGLAMPLLDTTAIHVEAAVGRMLEA